MRAQQVKHPGQAPGSTAESSNWRPWWVVGDRGLLDWAWRGAAGDAGREVAAALEGKDASRRSPPLCVLVSACVETEPLG